MKKPVVLIILDGWGMALPGPGNAVTQAKTPNFDQLWKNYPHTQLQASGKAVGLPSDQDGNSETGHLNVGAGRAVYQDLVRINRSIAEGTFFNQEAFLKVAKHVKNNNSSLHLMGLVSDSAVHASMDHLFALLKFSSNQGLKNVFLHLFADGRDSSPTSAMTYINKIEAEMKKIGVGKIATLIGRYYAMDRDLRWKRIQKAYELLALGKGKKISSIEKAISQSYQEGKTDEFIEPIVLTEKDGRPVGLINDNDGLIFYNFRSDRPRQLTKAFVLPDFETIKIERSEFDPYTEKYNCRRPQTPRSAITTFRRKKVLKNLAFVTMTEYEKGLPAISAFPSILVKMSLGELIAKHDLRQLRISETEKFPHITYFFNGGRMAKFSGEDQILIPSSKVSTYDLKPEMSAHEITNELLKRIKAKTYDFILVNFANPDMVGHTGVLKAGIKACEAVDECLGRVIKLILDLGGACIITADHGNAEEMINLKTGKTDTEHSNHPVPFIVVDGRPDKKVKILPKGVLADIAPTVLGLMDIEQPDIMNGKNLLV